MEQRIGSSSQPLEGAGFDPAFIPGLSSPVSGREEDAGAEEPEEPVEEAEEDATASEPPAEEEQAPEEEEPAPDGPVFEASDRRARILADHRGIRLRLDDQECEFRWDEIGAVETSVARFGKRYTVTVHTPERRWYPIEIEAPSRSRFAEWDAGLDKVLDVYFDDGGAEEADAEDKDGQEAGADAKDADAKAEAGAGTESGADRKAGAGAE
ncbi:hypothetical protein GCM10009535_05650 [Streptomyces thermocarboxydovorans]|uniref:Lipoprotein n=1 Tax=Streptomyces thermocarboxydovorans TaxID=59298 RepID=A0ABP3SCB7_9ACTN